MTGKRVIMDIFSDKLKKRQFFYSYIIFVLNGMLALSIGTIMPFIRDDRGLNYAFCGMLVSLHSLGNLFSSFFSGMLPALIGRKKSILLFNSFFALAYLLILFGNNKWFLVLAFLMTGLARGATSNFCNNIINNLSPGKAWIINGLHGMFSIGAFLFPLLLTALTSTDAKNWVYICYFMLLMGLTSWILYYLIPVDQDKVEKKQKTGTDLGFFREPLFYLCTLTLFFYLCAEQGVIGWLVTYFKDTGLLSDSLSQIMSSVLWIMILAGRLTTAFLSTKVKKERLLAVMGAGLVLFFVVLITSRSTGMILIGIMGFGYSMAGIYPTTVSFCGHIIQKYSMAWSFILTIASIGSIVMPSIIGRIAQSAGILYGMTSVGAAVIIDFVFIISLGIYIRQNRKKEDFVS